MMVMLSPSYNPQNEMFAFSQNEMFFFQNETYLWNTVYNQ